MGGCRAVFWGERKRDDGSEHFLIVAYQNTDRDLHAMAYPYLALAAARWLARIEDRLSGYSLFLVQSTDGLDIIEFPSLKTVVGLFFDHIEWEIGFEIHFRVDWRWRRHNMRKSFTSHGVKKMDIDDTNRRRVPDLRLVMVSVDILNWLQVNILSL